MLRSELGVAFILRVRGMKSVDVNITAPNCRAKRKVTTLFSAEPSRARDGISLMSRAGWYCTVVVKEFSRGCMYSSVGMMRRTQLWGMFLVGQDLLSI